jgi:hypothetical protein
MKRTLGLYVAWLVATVMLVLAVTGRHPYGFYTLLRWICCAAFAYSAFAAHEKNRVPWVWIFGMLAMLFNPIVPLHFQRDTWQMIDWVTIGVIVVAGIAFWPSEVFSQQFRFKISSTKNNALYDEVAEELQAKTMVPGLWTRAFAEAGGQMDRARALYIKYRVAQLAHEASEQLRQEQRATREAAKQQAATERVKQRVAPPAPTKSARSSYTPPKVARLSRSALIIVLGLCLFTAIAITGVGLLMLLGNIQQQDSKQATQKYTSTDSNAGQDTTIGDLVARSDLNKITLFDLEGRNRGVFGRVRNDLSRPVERIGLQASFYNPAGQLIAVRRFWISGPDGRTLPPVLPDSPAYFDALIEDMPLGCTSQLVVIEAHYAH